MAFRITIIFTGFGIAYVALLFNIFNLQLQEGAYYAARAAFAKRPALRPARRPNTAPLVSPLAPG